MSLPKVVTTSYLPPGDPSLSRHRAKVHLEALRSYIENFKDVGCLLSGYDDRDVAAVEKTGARVLYHSYQPKRKSFKQNQVLEKLYEGGGRRPLLLTDDDVVCNDEETVDRLKDMFKHPETMSAPCVSVVCVGRANAAYYSRERRIISVCPPSLCGWALLVQPSFGITYDMELCKPHEVEDRVIRCSAAVEGKMITRDSGLRFKMIAEDRSTVQTDFTAMRKLQTAGQNRVIATKYPKLLTHSGKYLKFSYQIPHIRESILAIGCGRMIDAPWSESKRKSVFVFSEGGYDKWASSLRSTGVTFPDLKDEVDNMDTLVHSKQGAVNVQIRKGVVVASEIADAAEVSLGLVLNQFAYLVYKGHVKITVTRPQKSTTVELV